MGTPEIIVIMIVALIIFGPGKLPEIGAQVGKTVRDFRKATRDLTSDFESSMNDVQSTMGEMKQTMADVQRETKELADTLPASIEGRDTPRGATGSSTAAATNAIGSSPSLSATSSPQAEDTPAEAPIAVTPEQRAAVASKNDPFADLAELEDEPVASGKSSSNS
ncbi:MAG: twin-arginine translocase TatA/TatE family subunit [Chloroflexota bacterium]|nr:twin-arginine translocase TatA/TatE family subunit [Chloroflexota bacterium]